MQDLIHIALLVAIGYMLLFAFPALIIYCSNKFMKWLNVYNPKRYRQLFETRFSLKQCFFGVLKMPFWIARAVYEAKFGEIRIVKKRDTNKEQSSLCNPTFYNFNDEREEFKIFETKKQGLKFPIAMIAIAFLSIFFCYQAKASEAQCYEYVDKLLKTELQNVSMLSVGKDLYDSTLVSLGLVLGQCVAYEKTRDSNVLKVEIPNRTYDEFVYTFYETRKVFFNSILDSKRASNE